MTDYSWAINKLKLARAIAFLAEEKKINPATVINEDSIKARYIKMAGLVGENSVVSPAEPAEPKEEVSVTTPKKVKK